MERGNLISYGQFLKDRLNFKRVSNDDVFDMPGHKYFKIMFHFWNGDSISRNGNQCGLLAPTWLDNPSEYDYYLYDSAWAYLKNNYEDERALKLEKFVNLLSTLSSEYPWYFQEITGLDSAIERTQVNEFKMDDARKKIQIKCLPDSYDQKIGTLLSLYREIVWSWSMKREVVPANLRKFDMSVFIWESPMYGIHDGAILNEHNSNAKFGATYKLIEFHNCEFDYNSLKSGYGAINNTDGITQEYTIDISFDDCYEHMYNQHLMRSMGDYILWDLTQTTIDGAGISSINYNYEKDPKKRNEESANGKLEKQLEAARTRDAGWYLENETSRQYFNGEYSIQSKDKKINVGNRKVLDGHKGSDWSKKGFLENLVDNMTATAVDELKTLGNRVLLGNLFTFSLSNAIDTAKKVADGNVWAGAAAIDDTFGTQTMNTIHNNSLNNLAARGQNALNNHIIDKREELVQRDIFPDEPQRKRPSNIGNLYAKYKGKTLINNL